MGVGGCCKRSTENWGLRTSEESSFPVLRGGLESRCRQACPGLLRLLLAQTLLWGQRTPACSWVLYPA